MTSSEFEFLCIRFAMEEQTLRFAKGIPCVSVSLNYGIPDLLWRNRLRNPRRRRLGPRRSEYNSVTAFFIFLNEQSFLFIVEFIYQIIYKGINYVMKRMSSVFSFCHVILSDHVFVIFHLIIFIFSAMTYFPLMIN